MEDVVKGADVVAVQVKPHRLDLTPLGTNLLRGAPAGTPPSGLRSWRGPVHAGRRGAAGGVRSLPEYGGRSRRSYLSHSGCVFSSFHRLPDRRGIVSVSLHNAAEFLDQFVLFPHLPFFAFHPLPDPPSYVFRQPDIARPKAPVIEIGPLPGSRSVQRSPRHPMH